MAGYNVRSLAELGAQARKFFVQAIDGAIASVWANTFTVIGKVLALIGFEQELRRRWLFKQIFASTADEIWLRRHGFELGLTQLAGAPAIGSVTITTTPGLVVPASLQFIRDDGATFTSVAGVRAAGFSAALFVQADDAGALGNTPAATVLTLVDQGTTPDGLGTDATVGGEGLGGGADTEALEGFRARVLARKRNPPQGGSARDYEAWAFDALDVVTAVYVDSFENDSRSVWVQFTVSDQPNGIPTVQQVAVVQDYLSDPLRRPVTARVFVSAPNPVPVDVTIQALSPDTLDIRASIRAELTAVFLDRARPGTPTANFRLYRSWLDEAISRAVGEDGHDLRVPATDRVFWTGQYPVLGNISYTD